MAGVVGVLNPSPPRGSWGVAGVVAGGGVPGRQRCPVRDRRRKSNQTPAPAAGSPTYIPLYRTHDFHCHTGSMLIGFSANTWKPRRELTQAIPPVHMLDWEAAHEIPEGGKLILWVPIPVPPCLSGCSSIRCKVV